MAKFNLDDYPVEGKKFNLEDYPIEPKKQSGALATTNSLLDSLSFGFADEITGGTEAAGRMVGLKGLGGPMRDVSLSDEGPTLDREYLLNAYREGRDLHKQTLAEGEKQHPGKTGVANVAGMILSPVNKIGAGMSLLKGGAVLGGISALGHSEADTVLGDVGNVALGTGLGAGLGYGAGKAIDKLAPHAEKLIALKNKIPFLGKKPPIQSSVEPPVQGPISVNINKPQSLEELRAWKPTESMSELPAKGRLIEVERSLPDLQTKPLKYHHDMLDNPKAMKNLKLQFENLPTKDAQQIAAYNQQMINESGQKVISTVDDLTKEITGQKPKSVIDSGLDFIDSVKNIYKEEKNILGPLFERFQKQAAKTSVREAQDLGRAIGENTKIGNILKIDQETGKLFLGENLPRLGMSSQEHAALKSVINDLNDGVTFKEIQNIRDFLRKQIDPSNPKATEELSKVRSIMLDYLETKSRSAGESVHSVFKKYAQNERARESIEQIIGGKIESLDKMFEANPQVTIQKIFSNPNHVEVVTNYVGPEKIQELMASHIKDGVSKSFDSVKGFDPSKLRAWLGQNSKFFENYSDPALFERLKSLADLGYMGKRFLDEVNPAGTAASLAAMIEPKTLFKNLANKGIVAGSLDFGSQALGSVFNQRSAERALDIGLGGTPKRTMSEALTKYPPEMAKYLGSKMTETIKQNAPQAAAQYIGGLSDVFNKIKGTKYEQVLNNAKQKGDQSAAAAHYVLSNQDAEYRKLLEDEGE